MTNPNDPAFSCVVLPPKIPGEFMTANIPVGLSKREWFAGMALQGLLADGTLKGNTEEHARWSVNFSDALIAALNEVKP